MTTREAVDLTCEQVGQTEEVVRHFSERCSVEISRGQKGTYAWTVKVRGDDDEGVMALLKKIDGSLRDSFKAEDSV